MRYCTQCGQMLREGAKFCHSCGHPVGQSVPVESSPAARAEPAPVPKPEAAPKPNPEVMAKLKEQVGDKLKHVAQPNLIRASGTPGEMTLTSWTTGEGGVLAGAAKGFAGKAVWPRLAEKIHLPQDRKSRIIVVIIAVLLLVLLISFL